ncbi:MAG: class I SAM-dependent methyltransferase [Candidatus Thorarchaeota archaeon]
MDESLQPPHTVPLTTLPSEGLIIDIGAGGEGLVSRFAGRRVCAVDIRIDEIREARIHGAPTDWFVSDGRHLCFRDCVFDIATLWFSLAFMRDDETKLAVLNEAYRVLRENGILSIMATHVDGTRHRHLFRALFEFPDGTLSQIGYGVLGTQRQDIKSVCELVSRAGFEVTATEDHDAWFVISAAKRSESTD